jgi:hypothetical protein
MAYTDKTRVGTFFKKRIDSAMVIHVTADMAAEFSAAGNYLVGNLPENALVTNAFVFTKTVATTGAIKVGTTENGTEILSVGASGTLGKTGTFTGLVDTLTGKPVYINTAAALTAGDFFIVIEYLEYDKTTKEYTVITQ